MHRVEGILQQRGPIRAGGSRRAFMHLFVAAALAFLASSAVASAPTAEQSGRDQETSSFGALDDGMAPEASIINEGLTIQPIGIPFLQALGQWERPGNGISMRSLGEPKSGTTWTERIITELALELCGSLTNTWCKMGGLQVIPNAPDPSYRWEMIHVDTGELFLHFDGKMKHVIPGLEVQACNPRGNEHRNKFGTEFPCKQRTYRDITREYLLQCLPDTSESCVQRMPSRDPAVRRSAVVFRDARDIVISEHRMRIEVFKRNGTSPLVPFIHERFKTIVSWQFVRWIWHTTFYKDSSHIMFYEDLQAHHEALRDLAAFMGLESSDDQLRNVWKRHRNQFPHGGFETHDLPVETINFMTTTMSKLLPEEILARYGVAQIP